MVDFTRIRAWQCARAYFIGVYDVTRTFPGAERFGFRSQLRRAARSIYADIAEGSGYRGNQDSARFYRMGFGSSSESYSDPYLARDVALLSADDFSRLESSLVPARKQLYQLIKSIDLRTGR
jgi:four helix bundle protein